MKLLLTSAGIKNPSIHNALVGLLGKPIAECNALCIPTAGYPNPNGVAGAWRFINGKSPCPMLELGWKSLGVLELTALPSLPRERWVTWVQETDALLVNGGDALYLAHWMRESGLADLLPSLDKGGIERGKHGDGGGPRRVAAGAPDRAGIHGMEAAYRGRSCAGRRGFFDVPALGSPVVPGKYHGQRREMGRPSVGPRLRDG